MTLGAALVAFVMASGALFPPSLPPGFERALTALTPAERAELDRLLRSPVWIPNPGAQRLLVHLIENTDVEEIWFMGEAGGGKTYAAAGLAGTHFKNTIFFRREIADLGGAEGIIERSRELFTGRGRFNGNDKIWRLRSNGKHRFLQFAGCQREDDKFAHQGRPHDCYVFDEITQFTPSIPAYITGWKRSSDPHQRTLELYLGNPPVSAEGEWVTDRIRPWVDSSYARPAMPGEIRYFVSLNDGSEKEVDGPEPVEIAGEMRRPKSRTYVPSVLSENPTYANGAYARTLDAMPEPYRSVLMRGDFFAARKDGLWQVIPTAWIKAAQARWRPDGYGAAAQDQVGMDVAHGGADSTVVVERRRRWFGMPTVVPGTGTPDGFAAADLLTRAIEPTAFAVVDANGVGASCYDIVKRRALRVVGVTGAESTERRDRSRKFGLANLRAALYWNMRELLDPESPTYDPEIALPPHPHVLSDLTAPQWTPGLRGIQIEPKERIRDRIGRSPDVGDALVLAAATFLAPVTIDQITTGRPSVFSDFGAGPGPGHAEAWS